MNRFKESFYIASLFFGIGTILLMLQAIFRSITVITIIGYYYVPIAGISNLIIIIALIFALFLDINKKETLKSIGVILINIPIAYIYYVIVMTYLI